MLVRLRMRCDALLIGAGTMRAERYGRPVVDPAKRAAREELGLAPDPLMAIVNGRLDLPWDAPLFEEESGGVLIFTASDLELPKPGVAVEVVRHEGSVDLARALRHTLRRAHSQPARLAQRCARVLRCRPPRARPRPCPARRPRARGREVTGAVASSH